MIRKFYFTLFVIIFISSRISITYSQTNDFFPLLIGNEKHYYFTIEYASYKSPIYGPESRDDYKMDSGQVVYKILGSTIQNDTTIIWTIREILYITSIQWHLDSLGIRDTTLYEAIDSTNYLLYEYTTGLHKIFANMQIMNLNGNIYRYSTENVDTITYHINDDYGYNIPYTFKKDIGLANISYSNTIIGNLSYIKFNKNVKLLDTLTNVSNDNIVINYSYLEQNYPNPFNPTTTIKFQIPSASKVEIKIFNCLGKEIKELINEYKNQGIYRINFDASNLSSGIYFYQLRTNNFISTKKMIVLR